MKLEKTANRELKKLYLWLNVSRLSLNVTKTKINNKAIMEKDNI